MVAWRPHSTEGVGCSACHHSVNSQAHCSCCPEGHLKGVEADGRVGVQVAGLVGLVLEGVAHSLQAAAHSQESRSAGVGRARGGVDTVTTTTQRGALWLGRATPLTIHVHIKTLDRGLFQSPWTVSCGLQSNTTPSHTLLHMLTFCPTHTPQPLQQQDPICLSLSNLNQA